MNSPGSESGQRGPDGSDFVAQSQDKEPDAVEHRPGIQDPTAPPDAFKNYMGPNGPHEQTGPYEGTHRKKPGSAQVVAGADAQPAEATGAEASSDQGEVYAFRPDKEAKPAGGSTDHLEAEGEKLAPAA